LDGEKIIRFGKCKDSDKTKSREGFSYHGTLFYLFFLAFAFVTGLFFAGAFDFGFPAGFVFVTFFVLTGFLATFFFGADFFAVTFAFGDFVFPLSAFLFEDDVFSSTNLSTIQLTLIETTSSPGFTSTITSPFVEARLRMPAASSRVDLGAALLK
jgi:hypothetical protein